LTLHEWINDGLMAVFFLLIGLEVKREALDGELASPRQAVLPIAGALGGMLIPAALFLLASGGGEVAHGWAIPMATDIAFALGVLALVAPHSPPGLKVFLAALAIVDDVGAVLIIAIFFTGEIAWPPLAMAGGIMALLVALNIFCVRHLMPYLLLGLGLWLTPGVDVSSPLVAFFAAWVYALVMTLITWAFSINSRDYLTVHAMRMGARGEQEATSDMPGVVFVQLDGVPAPLLESEIRSGNIPTISRWVRSGSHTWTEWTARVPSTTPVSQAGLLHGNNHGIPAFRWFDRELGRLLVANRPEDAAIIEARVGNGRGLLADDGVSISNLFSGDAATSLLTMSGLKEGAKGLGPSQSYAAFFTHPAGILRAVIMTVGEMVKEVFQARRQVRRAVEPRIHRGGAYVALRAVTNVFLRDLNVALVVEAMMKGSKAIYVDFVDYDEIAHHAGVTRTESLAAFYGLDDVLRSIEQAQLRTERYEAVAALTFHDENVRGLEIAVQNAVLMSVRNAVSDVGQ